MATIYKDGAKWRVNEFLLDAGSCYAAESADGNYLSIYLKANNERILYSKYTLIADSTETSYTKNQVLALLDEFIPSQSAAAQAAAEYPSGQPAKLTVQFNRPADTSDYAAGDMIGKYTVAVKQKETVTLSGVAAEAQVQTLTLSGTEGVANIGFPSMLTFDLSFDTDLSTTAASYVTDHAAAFLEIGSVVTSSGADLIFTASVAGTAFEDVVISPQTGDLDGTLVETNANVPLATATITGTGGLTSAMDFVTDATTTAAQFVTDYATAYSEQSIVVTSSGADLIFEASNAGEPFTAPVFTKLTGTFAGSVVHTAANATLEAFEFDADAAISDGGGCMITGVLVNAPATFSAKNVELYLLNDAPSSVVGDNVAFKYSDYASKTVAVIPIELSTIENTSTIVFGSDNPFKPFNCVAGSKKMYLLVKSVDAVTTPTSAGQFTITVMVTKQS